MKRVLVILLAIVMLLPLIACSNPSSSRSQQIETEKTQMSLDEMEANAEEFFIHSVSNEISENAVRAKEKYKGKIVTLWGYADTIKDDSVSISDPTFDYLDKYKYNSCKVLAYMPTEDLVKIDSGYAIKIVGEVADINNGMIKVNNAHFLTDVYEINNEPLLSAAFGGDEYLCAVSDEVFGLIYLEVPKKNSGSLMGKGSISLSEVGKYKLSAKGKMSEKNINYADQPLMLFDEINIK